MFLFYVCKDTNIFLFHQTICKKNKEITLFLTFKTEYTLIFTVIHTNIYLSR